MVSDGRVRIGTSGWRYAGWRGDFYPPGLVQRRELEHLASRLTTVEINGTFYSQQRPERFQRWRASVPGDFVFAVKGPRFITHMLHLRGTETALANFFATGVLALGDQLGPVLWQLPERMAFDADALDAFLARLPRTTAEAAELARGHDDRLKGPAWLEVERDAPIRYALEPRSPDFAAPEATALLERHGVALVVADTAGRWPRFDAVTADFMYVRLHGAEELYASGYTPPQLDEWAALIAGWRDGSGAPDGRPRDVYAYFDNDARGHAPHDAIALAERLGAAAGSGASS